MKNKYLIDWNEYARIARKAAAEGAVLLRNENQALPVKTGEKISLFGRIQFHYYKSGTGSGGMVNTRYVVGILDALKEEEEISLNEDLLKVYTDWVEENPFNAGKGWGQEPWSQEEMPLDDAVVEAAAKNSDLAVVVLGRTAGEDQDSTNTKGSYLLNDLEEAMLEKVCKAFDRVAVVLNVGNIIDMKWVDKYQPQAVLYTWQGGMEGGHAVADILTGRVNPCGKLSDTIAYSIDDYSSTSNFGGENGDTYAEDIYVGYRYFETFARDKVMYPFGFGLSYTSFEQKLVSVDYEEDAVNVTVAVTNTGAVSGKEVVQLYVNPAQGKLGKPVRNLAAFAKTKDLEPGESQELTLTFTDYVIASYDDGGVTGYKSAYVLEAGTYEIYAGSDVRSAKLVATYEVEETYVVEQLTEALSPVQAFNRMRPVVAEDGSLIPGTEPAPLRTYSQKERMENDPFAEIPFTGDKGIRLGDVYDKKADIRDFVGQLTDEDLTCIVRGEGMCSPKVTPGIASAFGGVTDELKAFGIPCGGCADGPSGIRMDCGTYAFSMPNGTCLACTFDAPLSEELYKMEGAELRKNRIDTLLGPGINLHRNPLNGRNFEYFSEDPLLTGKMTVAQLKGMAEYGVTGTIKHFATNNQEYHRRIFRAVISERALREIYLRGFEIAVKEGNAYSIMTTYGAINGVWTASNYDLLTTILRNEWGYTGMVMTDWWAFMNDEGGEPSLTNRAAMVKGQNDVFMVTSNSKKERDEDNLMESLANGSLSRRFLQRSAINILNMLMRSPVMERTLGRTSQEELEAMENMADDDKVDFDIEFHNVVDGKLTLDTQGLNTDKGNSVMFGICAEDNGLYNMHMRVKVDAGEVAQVNTSLFIDEHLIDIITMNGTGGEWVELDKEIFFFGPNHYLKFYFAQSGLQIDEISLKLLKIVKPFAE